jgi:hypothetical protein
MARASSFLALALAVAVLGVAAAKDTDRDGVADAVDTCPKVYQATQTGTASYCSTTNCNAACAVGCTDPTPATGGALTGCTQETKGKQKKRCGRCKAGFYPTKNSDTGCTANVPGTRNECTKGGDWDKDSVGNK